MGKINLNEIKNKVLELKEIAARQQDEIYQDLSRKRQRYEKIINESEAFEANSISILSSLMAVALLSQLVRKGLAVRNIKENEDLFNSLKEQNYNLSDYEKQIIERLNIVSMAEKHDLDDFLDKNNAFEIFEDGKFEEFVKDLREPKKESEKIREIFQGETNEQ